MGCRASFLACSVLGLAVDANALGKQCSYISEKLSCFHVDLDEQ